MNGIFNVKIVALFRRMIYIYMFYIYISVFLAGSMYCISSLGPAIKQQSSSDAEPDQQNWLSSTARIKDHIPAMNE